MLTGPGMIPPGSLMRLREGNSNQEKEGDFPSGEATVAVVEVLDRI